MIQCKDLTKRYGEFTAVNCLNLSIQKGEIFAFVGPNGAGKTTAMSMLVGLLEPTSGTASIDGYDVVKNPLKVKRILGYLPENVSLYRDMTARQNVRYIADLNGGVEEGKIDGVLDKVKLSAVKDKKTGQFSKGMTQRLGIACVLIKDPKVLFLDEPTSGLDPNGKIEIQDLLKGLKEEGKTIFFSSHILGEVKEISDRIGVVHKSRLERIVDKESIPDLEGIYKKITGIS